MFFDTFFGLHETKVTKLNSCRTENGFFKNRLPKPCCFGNLFQWSFYQSLNVIKEHCGYSKTFSDSAEYIGSSFESMEHIFNPFRAWKYHQERKILDFTEIVRIFQRDPKKYGKNNNDWEPPNPQAPASLWINQFIL